MQTNLLLSPLGCRSLLMGHRTKVTGIPLGGVMRGETTFIRFKDGVLILSSDRSYKRFISNSWYDDIDTDNL